MFNPLLFILAPICIYSCYSSFSSEYLFFFSLLLLLLSFDLPLPMFLLLGLLVFRWRWKRRFVSTVSFFGDGFRHFPRGDRPPLLTRRLRTSTFCMVSLIFSRYKHNAKREHTASLSFLFLLISFS